MLRAVRCLPGCLCRMRVGLRRAPQQQPHQRVAGQQVQARQRQRVPQVPMRPACSRAAPGNEHEHGTPPPPRTGPHAYKASRTHRLGCQLEGLVHVEWPNALLARHALILPPCSLPVEEDCTRDVSDGEQMAGCSVQLPSCGALLCTQDSLLVPVMICEVQAERITARWALTSNILEIKRESLQVLKTCSSVPVLEAVMLCARSPLRAALSWRCRGHQQ